MVAADSESASVMGVLGASRVSVGEEVGSGVDFAWTSIIPSTQTLSWSNGRVLSNCLGLSQYRLSRLDGMTKSFGMKIANFLVWSLPMSVLEVKAISLRRLSWVGV